LLAFSPPSITGTFIRMGWRRHVVFVKETGNAYKILVFLLLPPAPLQEWKIHFGRHNVHESITCKCILKEQSGKAWN
jgi:hypothetical protein